MCEREQGRADRREARTIKLGEKENNLRGRRRNKNPGDENSKEDE